MDAARSALRERRRLGHGALPPRPGRHAGPGGGDRSRRARGDHDPRGPRADEVDGHGRAGWPRSAVQAQRPTGARRSGRAVWEPVPGADRRSRGDHPRGHRRGARPVDPAPGAGIEVSAWAGIMADPRTIATGRAGVFAGGDVVSGPKTSSTPSRTAAAPPPRSTSTCRRARDGEAEILPPSGTRPRPEQASRSTSRRGSGRPLQHPVYPPGSFSRDSARVRRDLRRAPRPPAASAATPSTAAARAGPAPAAGRHDARPTRPATERPGARGTHGIDGR